MASSIYDTVVRVKKKTALTQTVPPYWEVNNASQTTPHAIEPLHKIHIICFSPFLYVAVLARKTLDSLPLFAPLLTNPAELMKSPAPLRQSERPPASGLAGRCTTALHSLSDEPVYSRGLSAGSFGSHTLRPCRTSCSRPPC